MNKTKLEKSIDKLGADFPNLNWDFRPDPSGGRNERISQWLGSPDEDVMICAYKGKNIHEIFHRQDFFFINFAYRGDYRALSARFDNEITIKQGSIYIGQPYSGYAIHASSRDDIVIPGILIKKETFFNEYLAPLSQDPAMLRFFLEPRVDRFSDEFIHITPPADSPVWPLLELMIMEYADKKEDTQRILKPMIFSVMMIIAREYRRENRENADLSPAEQMMSYIDSHLDDVTLSDLAAHFGYHPNYVSSMLHRETGSTFSNILLKKRMERSSLLLRNTTLSIEKIAELSGFKSTSNFYKAFRGYFGTSPMEHRQKA
jgi:AraC-like DNA-binding protein